MMSSEAAILEPLGWRFVHIVLRLLCFSVVFWPLIWDWVMDVPSLAGFGLLWGVLVTIVAAVAWLCEFVLARWVPVSRRRMRTDGWFVLASAALVGGFLLLFG